VKKIVERRKNICYIENMVARQKYAYTKEEAEKYKQIILYAIKTGADKDGRIAKTKLAKEVYLADFIWFYETNTPMSGMEYRKRTYGPVADAFFRIIEEMEEDELIKCERISNTQNDKIKNLYSISDLSKDISIDKLNNDEKHLIEQIAKTWENKRTSEIVDFTHKQLPWKICRDEEVIPYSLITQEDSSNVYGPVKLLRSI